MVAPELGMPLALKFALNQMKLPLCIGVPLKLEALEVGDSYGGVEKPGKPRGSAKS